jgi:N-acetylglutamate synthase-like GNAT family acetyltransferase
MFGMEIRAATQADIPQIVELVNVAFHRAEAFLVYGDRTNPAQIEAMFQTGAFLLAEISGQLAGCIYLEPRGDRAYFGLLSVDPSRQRQGVGRELVKEVERRARQAGCGIMDILTVNLRPELIPIYERMGYAQSGTAPFPEHVPTKIPCHFIRMSKDLR